MLNRAWVLVSTILVLGMMPALAFFEAGLLRSKNTLSILAQVLPYGRFYGPPLPKSKHWIDLIPWSKDNVWSSGVGSVVACNRILFSIWELTWRFHRRLWLRVLQVHTYLNLFPLKPAPSSQKGAARFNCLFFFYSCILETFTICLAFLIKRYPL